MNGNHILITEAFQTKNTSQKYEADTPPVFLTKWIVESCQPIWSAHFIEKGGSRLHWNVTLRDTHNLFIN